MDAQLKAKWVEALRSGKFEQNIGGIGDDDTLCCIGVGARVAGLKAGYKARNYTPQCSDVLGLSIDEQDTLVRMNDSEGKSFAEIADYIEANL